MPNEDGESNGRKRNKSEKFELPPAAKGKTLVDTVYNTDVDSLFQVQVL